MRLVQVKNVFYKECRQHGVDRELMFNERGRPCVLLIKMKYKNKIQKFVVPIRSNLSGNIPKNQYFPLPPNKTTKPGNRHGIHYIKIFPIHEKYIEAYIIDGNPYLIGIKNMLDKKEKQVVTACQDYLIQCENNVKHPMTPDIDGILQMINSAHPYSRTGTPPNPA